MCFFFFFFKQKTAYEMRISDWSSDVCSSDLRARHARRSDRPRRAMVPATFPGGLTMAGHKPEFHDRREAGRRLAIVLAPLAGAHPLVLALPRGGEIGRASCGESVCQYV